MITNQRVVQQASNIRIVWHKESESSGAPFTPRVHFSTSAWQDFLSFCQLIDFEDLEPYVTPDEFSQLLVDYGFEDATEPECPRSLDPALGDAVLSLAQG